MPYRVGRTAAVDEQIKTLAAIAKKLGILHLYLDALTAAIEHLAHHPLEWGDPEFRMELSDGVVCHGVVQPLLIRYAVFEKAEVVHLLEVKPFPTSVFFTR